MPYVPAINTLQAELVQVMDGQILENVLYFEASAGVDFTLMTDLATALQAWWTTEIAPGVSESLSLTQIVVTDLTTSTSPAILVPMSPPIPGEGTSPALPNNVALCLSFRTAFRGRSSRGRNYIAGLQENQVILSEYDAGVTDFFISAYQQLQGAGDFVEGLQWVVCSRISEGEPRTTALNRPIIAVTVVDQVVDSQRRRLPGRGR